MFTNQEMIAIAFRLINFAAVIGGAVFLFKKYALSDILLDIAHQQNKQDCLYKQQTDLEMQQHTLDILLQKDAQECNTFRARIDMWKKNVALEHMQREQERNKMMQLLAQRLEQQALQKEHYRVQTLVTHAIAHDIEKSLSTYFQDEKHGNDYLNSILQRMNENAS
ncbi:MAG TPA: hypothetical protein VKU36_05915 [Candidatus Babeliales bacterium]|nr:hypothetical protein [Candidatus Babeliales bacterium]